MPPCCVYIGITHQQRVNLRAGVDQSVSYRKGGASDLQVHLLSDQSALHLVLGPQDGAVGSTLDDGDSLNDLGDVGGSTLVTTSSQPSKPQALNLFRSPSVVIEDVQVAQALDLLHRVVNYIGPIICQYLLCHKVCLYGTRAWAPIIDPFCVLKPLIMP